MDFKDIKTYEDACKKLGVDPNALPEVSLLPVKDQAPVIAHYKLIKIAEALNNGWQPDWTKSSEYKYFPYFVIKKDKEHPSGFGFSFTSYADWRAFAHVGSRLCFKSSDMALYAGEQFADLYKEYFLINK